MKKTFLLALTLLSMVAVQAQTIHWLLFIDTTDANVGKVDEYGRQMLRDYFISEVNAVLRHEGFKTDIKDIYGHQVTPENCTRIIRDLKAEADDIIVFYYIGHGGRPVGDADFRRNHPFPYLCMAQQDPEKFIPLEWIDEELSKKGARLAVTIGMCCNSYSNIGIIDEPDFNPNYGPANLSDTKIARIKDLFLSHKGNLIATSASPGQTSIAVPVQNSGIPNNPADYRDAFTYTLYLFFKNKMNGYSSGLTWGKFLSDISQFIDKNTFHKQTPFHDVENLKWSPWSKKKEQQPIPNPTPISSSDLSTTLSTLIDTSRALPERQKLEMSLANDVFAQNAVVKFLGQDSETVIDKSKVEDWLGILSTNPHNRIYSVEVVDKELDSNGKIKTIRVKETYKK